MKLTKTVKMMGTFLLITLSLLINSNSASANTYKSIAVNEKEEFIQNASYTTRYIEVESIYWGEMQIPATVPYNVNGYSGTLTFIKTKLNKDTGHYHSLYGGYVRCEGVCMAPSSVQLEEE